MLSVKKHHRFYAANRFCEFGLDPAGIIILRDLAGKSRKNAVRPEAVNLTGMAESPDSKSWVNDESKGACAAYS